MKVALIHDHLAQEGGAEKVLQILAKIFPEAVIYTLLYDQKNVDKYMTIWYTTLRKITHMT